MLLEESKKIQSALEKQGYCLIEGCTLNPEFFNKNITNIAVKNGIKVFVDADLVYTGQNKEIAGLFSDKVSKGWREITLPLKTENLLEAMREVDTLLGLDERAPEIARSGQLIYKIPEEEKEKNFKIARFGRDLTKMAKEGKLSPVIGREKEMESLLIILSKKEKPNALLVGEPGTGKSSVVYGLVQKVLKGDIPHALRKLKIVEISAGYLMANAGYKGEVEQRIKEIIEEAERNPELVIFFDEVQSILDARGDVPVIEILKPALAKGDMRVIAACTPRDQRRIEADGALSRRFEKVIVNEPSEEETQEIIKGLKKGLEEHHGVKIPDEILEMAVKASGYYFTDRFFPDKALGLLDEAAARVNLEISQGAEKEESSNSVETMEQEMEEAIEDGDYAKARRLNNMLKESRKKQ